MYRYIRRQRPITSVIIHFARSWSCSERTKRIHARTMLHRKDYFPAFVKWGSFTYDLGARWNNLLRPPTKRDRSRSSSERFPVSGKNSKRLRFFKNTVIQATRAYRGQSRIWFAGVSTRGPAPGNGGGGAFEPGLGVLPLYITCADQYVSPNSISSSTLRVEEPREAEDIRGVRPRA